MNRRDFITLLGGAAAAGSVFWPLVARAAASSKRPRIAWIAPGTREVGASFIESFLRGMREFGHVEGRSFDMVYRFADGYQERLPALTEEVVRLKPDVILASAVAATVAARKATSTIPIVTPALADDEGLLHELGQRDTFLACPGMLGRHDEDEGVACETAVFQMRALALVADQTEMDLAVLDLVQDVLAVGDRGRGCGVRPGVGMDVARIQGDRHSRRRACGLREGLRVVDARRDVCAGDQLDAGCERGDHRIVGGSRRTRERARNEISAHYF